MKPQQLAWVDTGNGLSPLIVASGGLGRQDHKHFLNTFLSHFSSSRTLSGYPWSHNQLAMLGCSPLYAVVNIPADCQEREQGRPGKSSTSASRPTHYAQTDSCSFHFCLRLYFAPCGAHCSAVIGEYSSGPRHTGDV